RGSVQALIGETIGSLLTTRRCCRSCGARRLRPPQPSGPCFVHSDRALSVSSKAKKPDTSCWIAVTQSASDARIASSVGVILLAVRPASTSTVRQSMNDQSRSVLEDAAKYGIEYLEGLDARPVAPSATALARLSGLDRPLGDAPSPPEDVIRELHEIGSPATMASAGGRFFGFVIGGSLPVALAANWLAGAWDQNSGLIIIAPIVAKCEDVAAKWMIDLFGLPAGCGAGFVTSATAANFSALCAARRTLWRRRDSSARRPSPSWSATRSTPPCSKR